MKNQRIFFKTLSRFVVPPTKWASRFVLAFAAFSFVWLPSQNAAGLMGDYSEGIQKRSTLILIVLLITSSVLYLLQYFFQQLNVRESPVTKTKMGPSERWRRPVLILQLVLSAVILARVFHQVSAPLHWEDNYHFSNVIQDPLFRFNPLIKTEHHTFASVASYYSVQLFGMTKLAIRLPAILITIAFLILLNILSLRFFPPIASALVFLNLATNQMSLWFMTSMRGYIFAMFFTLASLYVILQMLYGKVHRYHLYAILFVLFAYCSLLTHLFASLANGLLFLSFLVWVRFSGKKLSRTRKNSLAVLILLYLGAALPAIGYVFYFQMVWLARLGDLFKGEFPDLGPTLMQVTGANFAWYGKILLLAVVFLMASQLFKKQKRPIHFLSIFFLVAVLFFATALKGLEVRLVETRFLLPFLAPFALWMGQCIADLKARRAILASGLAVVLLAAVPLKSNAAVYNLLTLNVTNFDRFISEVQKKTAPLPDNCYTYSGEPNLIYFTRTLYLGAYQGVQTDSSSCKKHYHLFFESPRELAQVDSRPTNESALYEVLLNYDGKMTLFQRFTPPELLEK